VPEWLAPVNGSSSSPVPSLYQLEPNYSNALNTVVLCFTVNKKRALSWAIETKVATSTRVNKTKQRQSSTLPFDSTVSSSHCTICDSLFCQYAYPSYVPSQVSRAWAEPGSTLQCRLQHCHQLSWPPGCYTRRERAALSKLILGPLGCQTVPATVC
jgi:hypothetical protein